MSDLLYLMDARCVLSWAFKRLRERPDLVEREIGYCMARIDQHLQHGSPRDMTITHEVNGDQVVIRLARKRAG